MKVVRVALLCFAAALAVFVGVARAAPGVGETIETASLVSPGVAANGSTALYADACDTRFEFWKLQLLQGDSVDITWGDTAAVDQFALWPKDTTDTAYASSCIYNHDWSTWNVSPVLAAVNPTPGTPLTTHATVDADGTYPLVFVTTTPANAGPYSFTVAVRHGASVSFAKQSAIPGTGVFKAAVVAPDTNAISDSTLKLTLNGYWSGRAGAAPQKHVLATATPIDGLVTFDYSLPPALWGKKIALDISGGGASYQPVLSERESVKVLIPLDAPVVASAHDLKATSKLVRQPIYWAGPRKGYRYEFTRTVLRYSYVRYLPHGAQVGDPRAKFLIVATYPLHNAYSSLKRYTHGKTVRGPHGSIYYVKPDSPTNVYVAFPKLDYEIEIFDPSAAVARKLAASGRIRPVR